MSETFPSDGGRWSASCHKKESHNPLYRRMGGAHKSFWKKKKTASPGKKPWLSRLTADGRYNYEGRKE
jgi:hypothetical protein